MDIHKFKKQYYDTYITEGLLGKKYKYAIHLVSVSLIMWLIWFLINFATDRSMVNLRRVIGYSLFYIILCLVYVYLLLVFSHKQIEEMTGKKCKNILFLENQCVIDMINDNFTTMLKDYNLMNDKIFVSNYLEKEKVDYLINALYKYADKIKYTWVTEKAIIGAILLPIWVTILEMFSTLEFQDFLITVIIYLLFILIGYLVIYAFNKTFLGVILNSESIKYYNLASKLELYKYGLK